MGCYDGCCAKGVASAPPTALYGEGGGEGEGEGEGACKGEGEGACEGEGEGGGEGGGEDEGEGACARARARPGHMRG